MPYFYIVVNQYNLVLDLTEAILIDRFSLDQPLAAS